MSETNKEVKVIFLYLLFNITIKLKNLQIVVGMLKDLPSLFLLLFEEP